MTTSFARWAGVPAALCFCMMGCDPLPPGTGLGGAEYAERQGMGRATDAVEPATDTLPASTAAAQHASAGGSTTLTTKTESVGPIGPSKAKTRPAAPPTVHHDT